MDAKAFLGRGFGFPVASRPDGGDVQLAEHEEDIRQAVRIILETNRGERLMRPDFGAGLNAFVFEPLNTATISLVRHRVEFERKKRCREAPFELRVRPSLRLGY